MKNALSYILVCVLTFMLSSCITPDAGTSVSVGYGYNIYYDNPIVWHRYPALPPPKPVYVPRPPRQPNYMPKGPRPSFSNPNFNRKPNMNMGRKPEYHNRTFGNMNKR